MIIDRIINIIGLHGKKGSGKNFVSNQFKKLLYEIYPNDNLYSYREFAFAEPIKQFVSNILGISSDLCYGSDENKDTITKYSWDNIPSALNKLGKTGYMTVREILQFFGTELSRDIWGTQIWTEVLGREINKYIHETKKYINYCVITDVRFENEIEYIKNMGGEIWFINGVQRKTKKKDDSHRSEDLKLNGSFDFVINNGESETEDSIKKQINDIILKKNIYHI